jgi:hypothetical protein
LHEGGKGGEGGLEGFGGEGGAHGGVPLSLEYRCWWRGKMNCRFAVELKWMRREMRTWPSPIASIPDKDETTR